MENQKLFPRRRPPVDAYNGIFDPEIIGSWLQKCTALHHECTKDEGGLPDNLMLIDVKSRRLTQYQPGFRYLTLSYVWGKGAQQQRHWLEPQADGSQPAYKYQAGSEIPSSIPKTIDDAIQLVKALDEQYLWVDLLCINQMDELEKQEAIEAMDVIFASSWLTICCVDGPDAGAGLPGITRYMLQTRQPTVLTSLGRLTATYIHSQWQHNGDSKWDSRAWTLQERILSRRCLFLADTYVSMSCREEHFHELIDINVKDPHVVSYLDNSWFREDGSSLNIDNRKWDFDTYGSLVAVFTGREITDQNDILNACRGSLKRLTVKNGMKFHFGLPKDYLLETLLFIPHIRHKIIRRPGFPSWSWLGWKGRTEYPYWLHYQHNFAFKPKIEPSERSRLELKDIASSKSNGLIEAIIVHDETMTAPVIQLKTVIRSFKAQMICLSGARVKPSDEHDEREALGDQWALLKDDNTELFSPTNGAYAYLEDSRVSFRLHADESRQIMRQKNRVDLALIKYWPFIWDLKGRVLKQMVSCLVVRTDKEGCYHRIACVIISVDDWLARPWREETITMV